MDTSPVTCRRSSGDSNSTCTSPPGVGMTSSTASSSWFMRMMADPESMKSSTLSSDTVPSATRANFSVVVSMTAAKLASVTFSPAAPAPMKPLMSAAAIFSPRPVRATVKAPVMVANSAAVAVTRPLKTASLSSAAKFRFTSGPPGTGIDSFTMALVVLIRAESVPSSVSPSTPTSSASPEESIA